MSHERSRIPLIDAIKAIAAQLIVLHHLAWYGPMSDSAAGLASGLHEVQLWLGEYGRLAVAAFFACGGFLATQALSVRGLPEGKSPSRLIVQRYLRLAGPYAVALVLAVVAAAWARQLMTHESIGAPPTVMQFLAHLFLLHDVLKFEALSAGVWYVAIDFQLYALLVLLLWTAGHVGRRRANPENRISFIRTSIFVPLLVVGGVMASLFYFNRKMPWDVTALYFFGVYGLGVIAGWAARSRRPYAWLSLVAVLGCAALWLDYRPRVALALAVALVLGMAHLHLRNCCARPFVDYLSRTSYALFLVHFPVCLLVNAVFQQWAPHAPLMNAFGVLLAWGASNVAAALFYRHVEMRLAGWQLRLAAFLRALQPATGFATARAERGVK